MARFAGERVARRPGRRASSAAAPVPSPGSSARIREPLHVRPPAQLAAVALGLRAGRLRARRGLRLVAVRDQARLQIGSTIARPISCSPAPCNAADGLFLHVGFCALAAMSRTGQSRPFHRDADGLVPAEGAALIALKRLADARAAGDRILGVIRGVGLSNDGPWPSSSRPPRRARSAPCARAYACPASTRGRLARQSSATPPARPSATPPRSRSMAALFDGQRDVPIGSLKSNLGHLITVAGVAGIMKVLGAFEAGVRPPTLHAEAPIDALRGSPLRLLANAEAVASRTARASPPSAPSASAATTRTSSSPRRIRAPRPPRSSPPRPRPVIAVVGIGAMLGDTTGAAEAARRALRRALGPAAREVTVSLEGLARPAARSGADAPAAAPRARSRARRPPRGSPSRASARGVLVGMGRGPRDRALRRALAPRGLGGHVVTRAGRQGRLRRLARQGARRRADQAPGRRRRGDHAQHPRQPHQQPARSRGPRLHGLRRAGLGCGRARDRRARLARGRARRGVVGAVDLSDEPVHRAALGPDAKPGDAAVVLVLKRLDDAQRDGDRVLAVLDGEDPAALRLGDGRASTPPRTAPPTPPPASCTSPPPCGACSRRRAPPTGRGADAVARRAQRRGRDALARRRSTSVRLSSAAPAAPLSLRGAAAPPRVRRPRIAPPCCARSRSGPVSTRGPRPPRDRRRERARAQAARLAQATALPGEGRPRPRGHRLPRRARRRRARLRVHRRRGLVRGHGPRARAGAALRGVAPRSALRHAPGRDLAGSSARPRRPSTRWSSSGRAPILCQLHVEISRGVLGLPPQATIGYSSGESNALFASGAWRDLDAMVAESWKSPIFTDEIVGEFAAARRAWRKLGERRHVEGVERRRPRRGRARGAARRADRAPDHHQHPGGLRDRRRGLGRRPRPRQARARPRAAARLRDGGALPGDRGDPPGLVRPPPPRHLGRARRPRLLRRAARPRSRPPPTPRPRPSPRRRWGRSTSRA